MQTVFGNTELNIKVLFYLRHLFYELGIGLDLLIGKSIGILGLVTSALAAVIGYGYLYFISTLVPPQQEKHAQDEELSGEEQKNKGNIKRRLGFDRL